MDEFVGNGDANTITAGTVNAKTGAAETTINDGDEIDGGAGTDTLNITATADNNTSLTGLSVKNVEVVNITGANNLGVSSTDTDAASAGVAGVTTLTVDATNFGLQGEVVVIDLGDLASTAASAAGDKIVVTQGTASYDIPVEGALSSSALASAIAAVLDNDAEQSGTVTAGMTGATGLAQSVTASGSKITIAFKPEKGNVADVTFANGATTAAATFDAGNTNDAVSDISVTVEKSSPLHNSPAVASEVITLSAVNSEVITFGNLEGDNAYTVTNDATATKLEIVTAAVAALNGKAVTQEVQTIEMKYLIDATATTTSNTITVGGIDVALSGTAVGDYATLVADALNGQVVTTATGDRVKVKTSTSGTNGEFVDIRFDVAAGNVGAITVAEAADDNTWVVSTTATSTTITDAVVGAEVERGSGIVKAEASGTAGSETLTITYGYAFGAGAATGTSTELNVSAKTATGTSGTTTSSSTQADGTAALGSATSSDVALSDIDLVVNGGTNNLGSITFNAQDLAGIAAGEADAIARASDVIRDAAYSKLLNLAGDSSSEIDGSSANSTVVITSAYKGGSIGQVSIDRDGSSLGASAATTPAKNATAATTQAQVLSILDSGATTNTVGDMYIDGVNYGTVAHLTSATVSTALADAINAVLGDGVAVQVGSNVTVTAPVAGTPLPAISFSNAEISVSEVKKNIAALGTTTTVADAAVSGLQFSGADEVWLVGSGSNATNLTVTGTQVAGLNKVTGIVDSVYTLGTASTLAISGATTTATGTATINGGGTTLNIIGAGTSGFSLTENSSSTATDDIDTLAIDTSGATVLTVSGLTALETITQSGAGALTIKGAGIDVATITGGAAADKLTLNTATVVDTVSTAKDETVTGSLTGGAGNDVIVVTTSGAGVASVDAGAGNDTIKVAHTMTGEMQIAASDGDDTVWLTKAAGATTSAVSQLNADISVDGGDGTDTLALGGDQTYLTGDYTKLQKYATGFEKVTFYGATGASATPLDASKLAGIGSYTVSTGANFLEEVANGTAFTNTVIVREATDYLGEISNYGASGLTIVTADYEADTDFSDEEYDAVYGQDISITHATLSQSSALADLGANYGATYTVSASDVTLVALSVGGATAAASSKADVTLKGQMETATVILSGARGATKTSAGNGADEYMATFAIEVDPSAGTNAMQGLKSITVSGSGVVTIDAGYDGGASNDSAAANLTVIDLSGMTDFADLTYKGEAVNDTYTNLSTSTVTLNSEVAETLKLGGALDTVLTDSSVDFMDIIEGFSLIATADEDDDDDIVDYAQSDVLNVSGTRGTADNNTGTSIAAGTSGDQFTADDTAYASLDAALLSLAATASNEVVFHAEGNTYVFISDADTELDAGDTVIQLTGTYDLDLLVNAII